MLYLGSCNNWPIRPRWRKYKQNCLKWFPEGFIWYQDRTAIIYQNLISFFLLLITKYTVAWMYLQKAPISISKFSCELRPDLAKLYIGWSWSTLDLQKHKWRAVPKVEKNRLDFKGCPLQADRLAVYYRWYLRTEAGADCSHTYRDAAPLAPHAGQTFGRPACLLTPQTLGVSWKVAFPPMVIMLDHRTLERGKNRLNSWRKRFKSYWGMEGVYGAVFFPYAVSYMDALCLDTTHSTK